MLLKNPIFDKMKTNSLWTVSSNEKMPLDLQHFINYMDKPDESISPVKGAKYQDHRSLGTYSELEEAIPNHKNATYYFNSLKEDYILLDVEPKCPEHILKEILQLPAAYIERSMSGKGYHLLLPKPKNFNDYPNSHVKTQLQDEHGYYEILMNHYVTFTGNEVPLPAKTKNFTAALFKSLAEHVIATKSAQLIDAPESVIENVPYYETIIDLVLRKPFANTEQDYSSNLSKYEMAMMCYYANRIYKTTQLTIFNIHKYSDEELLAILYNIIQQELPYREKHDESRPDAHGNPIRFLYWRCNQAMAHTLNFYKEKEEKQKKKVNKR